jgi:hypothetical protein
LNEESRHSRVPADRCKWIVLRHTILLNRTSFFEFLERNASIAKAKRIFFAFWKFCLDYLFSCDVSNYFVVFVNYNICVDIDIFMYSFVCELNRLASNRKRLNGFTRNSKMFFMCEIDDSRLFIVSKSAPLCSSLIVYNDVDTRDNR